MNAIATPPKVTHLSMVINLEGAPVPLLKHEGEEEDTRLEKGIWKRGVNDLGSLRQ
jgi:hypothetical protein